LVISQTKSDNQAWHQLASKFEKSCITAMLAVQCGAQPF